MYLSDSMRIEARERWLPFVQQFALSNGWNISGDDLERFVDSAVPYLATMTVTTLDSAERVLTNYYQDAPLIQLLLHDKSHQSDRAWSDITDQCVGVMHGSGLGSEEQVARVAQIQGQFRAILIQHLYQAPLWIVLAAFVDRVDAQPPGCLTPQDLIK